MCEVCETLAHLEDYIAGDTVWEYGIFHGGSHEVKRRVKGTHDWFEVSQDDLAEMTENHIEFYEALRIPF